MRCEYRTKNRKRNAFNVKKLLIYYKKIEIDFYINWSTVFVFNIT